MQRSSFPLQILRPGPACVKMGCCEENVLLCRTHYARIYSAEWIAVDRFSHSHLEFNLSSLKAHLRDASFANLLWLRGGLLCCLKEMSKCCKFDARYRAFNSLSDFHGFLNLALKGKKTHHRSSFFLNKWNFNIHLKDLKHFWVWSSQQVTENSVRKKPLQGKDKPCYPCQQRPTHYWLTLLVLWIQQLIML